MQKIVFTNANGQSITLESAKPYLLLSITGTGAAETDVQMQKAPFQDGQTYIDTLLEPRIISIEVAILASTQEELHQKRREIAQVFNPKLGPGTLRYEYDGGVKEIEAVSDLAPVFPSGSGNQAQGFQKALISLVCPSPFWLDVYEESQEMSAWLGGLEFPLEFDPDMSFEEAGDTVTVTNAGDVETPVTIEFNGPAENPRVDNLTTGEYVRVNRTLLAGEKLIIKTAFGQKSVTLVDSGGNESNAMHYIDLNSTFWQLQPGENTISYTADSGAEEATVLVTWKNRYVGV